MSKPEKPLDAWLLNYIIRYQPSKSRYEIDRYLLDTGFEPAELEAAWQAVLLNQIPLALLPTAKAEFQTRPLVKKLVVLNIGSIVLTLCSFLFPWREWDGINYNAFELINRVSGTTTMVMLLVALLYLNVQAFFILARTNQRLGCVSYILQFLFYSWIAIILWYDHYNSISNTYGLNIFLGGLSLSLLLSVMIPAIISEGEKM